jgi:hypothetical protein
VWGSGCIDPHFFDLGTSWRWVVSFTPLPLYPRYPLDKKLGGPQSQSGRRGENSCPHRDSNSDPVVVQPVASRYTNYATGKYAETYIYIGLLHFGLVATMPRKATLTLHSMIHVYLVQWNGLVPWGCEGERGQRLVTPFHLTTKVGNASRVTSTPLYILHRHYNT